MLYTKVTFDIVSLFSPSTTGLPDSSAGMINPYPLVELKNFTCPDFRGADDADDDIEKVLIDG